MNSADIHAADLCRTSDAAKREAAALWMAGWVAVGVSDDITGAGDILPYTIGNMGVHVERLANGSLVCRVNLSSQ